MRQYVEYRFFFGILLVTLIFCSEIGAAPINQSFTINPGWNAIFLEVEPADPDPAAVFLTLPGLTTAWMWNPRVSTVEFIQNPNELVEGGASMLVYKPGDAIVTNLFAIHGNTAYLINYGGASTVSWQVSGEPLPPDITWKPNDFNFVGFHLDQSAAPFYHNFFDASPAHSGQEIFRLENGLWVTVTASDTMQKGEAFWVYCKGSSEFAGQVTARLTNGGSLAFGEVLEQQEIQIKNNTNGVRNVALGMADNGVSPNPVFYWDYVPAEDIARWVQMPSASSGQLSLTIAGGESQTVKIGVKRSVLSSPFAANLQVNDDVDGSFHIPVSVSNVSNAGLWVGEAKINKVSQPADLADPGGLKSTGSEFPIRLILHVDSSGVVRLMNQVIQMWQEGTWKPDPNDLSKLIVDQPGHFVLFADDALIASYSGASLRDGQPVGRRISSAAFGNFYDDLGGPAEKIVHEVDFPGIFGGSLTTSLLLPMDDPTNPFVHRYHNRHQPPDGSEGATKIYSITRSINMVFSDSDSDGNPILGSTRLGWGSTIAGGRYAETISGLTGDNIAIEGVFTLQRVSNVDTLTTN